MRVLLVVTSAFFWITFVDAGHKRVIIRVPQKIKHIYHHHVKKVPVYVILPNKKSTVLDDFEEATKVLPQPQAHPQPQTPPPPPPPPPPQVQQPCKEPPPTYWQDDTASPKYRYARHYDQQPDKTYRTYAPSAPSRKHNQRNTDSYTGDEHIVYDKTLNTAPNNVADSSLYRKVNYEEDKPASVIDHYGHSTNNHRSRSAYASYNRNYAAYENSYRDSSSSLSPPQNPNSSYRDYNYVSQSAPEEASSTSSKGRYLANDDNSSSNNLIHITYPPSSYRSSYDGGLVPNQHQQTDEYASSYQYKVQH